MASSDWSTRLADTVAAEFSDVPDLEQLVRILVRLLLAAVLGFVLGFEREQQGKAAGVGFLCASTILKRGRDEAQVQGLTTAAGLWLTAAIGMACGLGREVTAIMSALLALAVFALIPRLVSPRAAANTDTDAHKAPAADRPG